MLEDKTLFSFPAVSVSLETVHSIEEGAHDSNGIYLHRSSGESITINKKDGGDEFVKGLKRGDRIILVYSNDIIIAAYGPIERDKLYTRR